MLFRSNALTFSPMLSALLLAREGAPPGRRTYAIAGAAVGFVYGLLAGGGGGTLAALGALAAGWLLGFAARLLTGLPLRLPLTLAGGVVGLLLPGVAAALHPSASNEPGSPRQRVLIPLSRPVTDPAEFNAVSRIVAGKLGAERFDAASYDWNRLMYWPACCSDETLEVLEVPGQALDPDRILAEWGDWSDASKLPGERKAKRETTGDSIKKHPVMLAGLRGAFHEVYGSIE